MIDISKGILKEYVDIAEDILQYSFPNLNKNEIKLAIEDSIHRNFKDNEVMIDNNYTKKKSYSTIQEIVDYILERKPIITAFGVLFEKHGTSPNPIYRFVDRMIVNRGVEKKKMFKYPKGSEMYEKHNLLQLLLKIDANSFYGALGQYQCLFFNIYVASSITMQGRSAISASGLLFESFLNNNVPFGSLDEIIMFIHNVKKETRVYNDIDILDRNIDIEECFFKLISTCGFDYTMTEEDADIIWDILLGLSHNDINRLFYKNNLYHFLDNTYMRNKIIDLFSSMNRPYMDPYKVPEEHTKVKLDAFWDLLSEYVYYDKQIVDRLDKMDSLIRSVTAIMDTDSCIISLDAWYRYALDVLKDTDLSIKYLAINPATILERDEFGDLPPIIPARIVKPELDYDFMNDEIIELERVINPAEIIPQDGLKYTIINVMAYCTSKMIDDYMYKYTESANSNSADKRCMMVMKNEFFMLRVLLTEAKKNYASIQALQEGKVVPKDKQLDVKGIPQFTKVTMNETTRKHLTTVLYEDIMTPNKIDQLKILKDIAIEEKIMFEAMRRGEKLYYKPANIKSLSNYDNPMGIQGIKASIVYNNIKDEDMDPIDLSVRNSIVIIKCDISNKNVDKIKDEFPDTYERMIVALDIKELKGNITSIALPDTQPVPKWIIPFINYSEIISDNVKLFPLEYVGTYRGNSVNTYTNIVKI